MEQHLEQALYEVLFALAEFEQTRRHQAQQGSTQDLSHAAEIETLNNSLRISLWGLETALRAFRDIGPAQARKAG